MGVSYIYMLGAISFMIDKVYRFIYLLSLAIITTSLLAVISGRYFFNNFSDFPNFRKVVGILLLIAPFAPIGTLFGTLKEGQSDNKKISIFLLTGLSVLFLLLFIWGVEYAAAFA